MTRALGAELRKLLTLPGALLALTLCVAIPVLLAWLEGARLRAALDSGNPDGLLNTSTTDSGFGALTFAQVGFVVLGVLAVSSEYARSAQSLGRGRQLTTSMAAEPRGAVRMAAKLLVLIAASTVAAVAATAATLAVSRHALGGYATDFVDSLWSRSAGAVEFLVVMAVLAAALAELMRGGTVPLVLLLANASMVSLTLLLSQITSLARYLPDAALYPSFLTEHPMRDPLPAEAGVLVGAGWAVGAAVSIVWLHARREA